MHRETAGLNRLKGLKVRDVVTYFDDSSEITEIIFTDNFVLSIQSRARPVHEITLLKDDVVAYQYRDGQEQPEDNAIREEAVPGREAADARTPR